MIKRTMIAAAVAALAVNSGTAIAQANPATPMPVIDATASELCGAIDADPTEGGVIDAVNDVDSRGLDEMDGAMVMITAMHHVCPQHQELMWRVIDPVAAQELCTKPV